MAARFCNAGETLFREEAGLVGRRFGANLDELRKFCAADS